MNFGYDADILAGSPAAPGNLDNGSHTLRMDWTEKEKKFQSLTTS